MKSSERVMAAIQGKPTDRNAVALTLSLYGAKLIGAPLKEYYNNPKLYAEGQLAVRETFEPDILLAPFALSLLGAAFGGRIKYFDNHPPNISEPALSEPEELLSARIPNIDTDPILRYIRESLREMVSNANEDYPVSAIALSPIDLPIMLMGIEKWLDTVLFKQDLTKRILEISIDFFLNWTNVLFEDGATCVILPAPFANLRIVTKKFLTQTAIPTLIESFSKCQGPLIMHHCGTSYIETLEYIKELPNVIGYCVGKEDNLEKSREIIGKDTLLLGNIDGPSLYKLSAESIFKRTCKILDDRKGDQHFILATSAADVDLDTPEENIHAIMQAVKEHYTETTEVNA